MPRFRHSSKGSSEKQVFRFDEREMHRSQIKSREVIAWETECGSACKMDAYRGNKYQSFAALGE